MWHQWFTVILWSYENTFVHKENKLTTLFYNFVLFCVMNLTRIHESITHTCVCIALLVNKAQAIWVLTSECRLLRHQHHMHVLCYSHERVSYSDTEEKKLLNKVLVLFSLCKKSILVAHNIMVEPLMSHGTILTMYLLPFWALNVVVACCLCRVRKLFGFHHKISSFVFPKMNKDLWVWIRHEGE